MSPDYTLKARIQPDSEHIYTFAVFYIFFCFILIQGDPSLRPKVYLQLRGEGGGAILGLNNSDWQRKG